MNEIVVKIKGDSKDIERLAQELKNLGKVDEENAKQFKKNNDDFKKGAKESKSALNEVFSEITDIKGQLVNLGKGIVAAFAVEAVIGFGKESVSAFMEAELNARKLQAAVKNIAKESDAAAQALLDQSDVWQSQSIYSDDAIQAAQTQLIQFGLTTKQVQDLIPRIIDLASATGESGLAGTTDLLIAGLNGQMRGLKSIGAEFNATGDIAQDFNLIMQSTEKFVGSAATTMETAAGKAQYYRNRLDEIKESVGKGIVVTVDFIVKGAEEWLRIHNKITETAVSRAKKGAEEAEKLRQTAIEKAKKDGYDAASDFLSMSKYYTFTLDAYGRNQEKANEITAKTYAELKRVASGKADDIKQTKEQTRNVFYLTTQLAKQEEIIKGQTSTITQINAAVKQKNALEKELNALLGKNTSEQKKNTDTKKEDLTTLQSLKKAYDDLADAVDKNAQNGKVDRELIKKRDDAQKALTEGTFKYEKALLEANGMRQISRKEIQATEIDEKAKFDEQMQMMEKAHQGTMNQIAKDGAEVRKMTAFEEMMAISRILIDSGQTLVNSLNLQGEQAKSAQKGFALANLAFSTAEAISNIVKGATASSAQVAAASGPLAPITGPAAYAAFMGQLVTVFANLLQAKQIIMGYKDGTPSLQRNGNPAGVDTIPIMANEGEAIIPTEKNRQKPGLAAAWIKGNLDDYINVNYVIPALKRNKIDKDEAFASRIGKAISMSASFNDMNLLQSDKENRRILRSIDKTLKSGSMGLSRRKF